MKILRIGVAGHALLEFDGPQATELLAKGIDQAIIALRGGHEAIEIVCNLTNPTLSRLGHFLAVERGWMSAGVAHRNALNYSGHVERVVIADDDWVDVFVGNIDALVRVGGASTTADEVAACRAADKPVYEFDL